jgi:lysophospholipase L1-like esterase
MKVLLIGAWLLALGCAALAGCGGSRGKSGSRAGAAAAPVVIAPSDPGIRFVGRWDTSDPELPRSAWPAAAFAFRFTGTAAGLVLEDSVLSDDTPDGDWLAISLDGRDLPPVALSRGRRTYGIARGLAPGTHAIAVAKRTEAGVGTIGLVGIALDPGASLGPLPEPPGRVVEIVGDSISTGFGIDGESADCPFSAATEDATRTYGALAARELGADVWIAAWQGKGVLRNNDPDDADTLPRWYERLRPGDPDSVHTYGAHPDVVVLNIGTNDFAHTAPPGAEFYAAYAAFVARLRALHPGALLVLALGPLLRDEADGGVLTLARDAIGATLADRREQGDEMIEMIEFMSDPADGVGCQGHPNGVAHRRMADELMLLLEAKLGWKRQQSPPRPAHHPASAGGAGGDDRH